MLAPEILAQVRRLEIVTGRLVREGFAGDYHSVFKGRGMEFLDVREYADGDEPRDIDRNVSARAGRPFVRRHTEERELTVMIAVDLSASQSFGTADRLKREAAAEAGAILAFSALLNGDKVGLAVFTEEVELFVPPRKGRRHVLHILRELLAFEPARRGTRLGPCLERVTRLCRRRGVLVLLSDFRDEGFERALKLAALRHDLVPVLIEDPREAALPRVPASIEVRDPESGRALCLDPEGADSLRREEESRRAALEALLRSCGLEAVRLGTDRPTVEPLAAFFRRRARRRAR